MSKLKGINFWRKQFAILESSFSLRPLRSQPASRRSEGTLRVPLDRLPQEAVNRISREKELETFIVILSGLFVLLHKYTGYDSLCIHTPELDRTNRPRSSQSIPIILVLDGSESLKELIITVDETVRESYRYQSNLPFFEAANGFGYLRSNVLVSCSSLHGICDSETGFDLRFQLSRELKTGQILLDIFYDLNVFEDWLITDIAAHLQQVVSGYSDSSAAVASLRVISKDEESKLLISFNHYYVESFRNDTLVARFQAQVRKTPEKAAVLSEDVVLSYAELDSKSDQLATYLRAKFSIQDEDLVAIYSEKSERTIIAILGILKAGAAYLPLDIRLPPPRLSFILSDARIRLLVTESNHMLDLTECPCELFCIDVEDYAQSELAQPVTHGAANSLAYVIYTSGSTGEAKGVCIEHRTIVSYLDWKCSYYQLDDSFVTLQIPSLSFDSSVSDIFSTLVSGGALLLLRDADRLSPRKIAHLLKLHKVTNFVAVPSLYRVILPVLNSAGDSLRFVTLAGEAVPFDLALRHKECLPHVRLVNEYGPTENSVGATAHEYFNGSDTERTIGKPMSHTLIYVLNEKLLPVPVGIAGNIFIGGSGLARGYLNRPSLTEHSFLPNPFRAGERIYRTGDLGRWLPDGNIEFIGRKDGQVKIRGYRVEVAEVEAVLRSLEGIEDGVVTVSEGTERGSELIAYLLAAERHQSATDIKERLREILPEYMVPAHLVFMPSFPLNSNGKINRNALPPPTLERDGPREPYQPPGDSLERMLVEIWEEELKVIRVGVNDNLFELGAHSLKAVQIALRIQEVEDVELGLSELFSNPTVRELSALIRRRIGEHKFGIRPLPRQDLYEVSHAQRRMWVLQQLADHDHSPYNIPDVLLLEGKLDVNSLRRSFRALILRHESLRTAFIMRAGALKQVVNPDADFQLEVLDLTESSQSEEQLNNLANVEMRLPFSLDSPPLLRARLIRLQPKRHALLLTIHHIICDEVSAQILVSELLAFYEATLQGVGAGLPPLRIQHKDFVAWQNAVLKHDATERSGNFWRQKLRGGTTSLNLPTDYPRPPVQTFNGDTVKVKFDGDQTALLTTLAGELQVSMFMVLQAVIKVLLYRHTSQSDITVGSPILAREQPELKGQIGLFQNTLALRDCVLDREDFKAFALRVKQTTLEAFEHRAYPFDLLVDELAPLRDLSRNPLFDVMFLVEHEGEAAKIGGAHLPEYRGELVVSRLEPDYNISKFDLTFVFNLIAGQLGLTIQYNTDLFSKERIQRMSVHLIELVGSILREPNRPIGDLQLLSQTEQERILHEFNDRYVGYSSDETVIDLFEKRVIDYLDRKAIEDEKGALTYLELNQRANQLAHLLINQHAVGRGDFVAIRCERSAAAIIAALGILKTGAAYIPIDPHEPDERAAYFLKDSGAELLLSSGEHPQGFGGMPASRIVNVSEVLTDSTCNPQRAAAGSDLCYAIYTSGTTGVPKGVMIEHRSLINLVNWHHSVLPVDEATRSSLYSSPGFDASILELWPTLLGGGCLVPVPSEARLDPEALVQFFRDANITRSFLPTAVCEIICATQREELDPKLTLLTGGELLRLTQPAPVAILNNYGPTEATVTTTALLIPAGEQARASSIGKPISNCEVYVLDSTLALAPIGLDGEICIGGMGVARGYLGDAALTASCFVPHPFRNGARLYRTGDVGRWLGDGSIEFRGRVDRQVKVRGYRVDPAEIEAVMLALPAVNDALVCSRERHGTNDLIAYVVLDPNRTVAIGDIRAFLGSKVPNYMIPSGYCVLETLPRSTAGKIDYKALPAVETHDETVQSPLAVSSPTIEILSNIWGDVLGVKQVSSSVNFFELGGDSLKAMRVIAQVRERMGVEVTLRSLFSVPTLTHMSACIARLRGKGGPALPPMIASTHDGETSVPLSLAQEQLWAAYQLTEEAGVPNISCTVRAHGPLDVGAFRAAIAAVCGRHEALRTRFAVQNGKPVQVISDKHYPYISQVDFGEVSSHQKQERTRSTVREATAHQFDLSGESLLRVTIITFFNEQQLITFTMPHIISDGWSLGVLIHDVAALYRSYRLGEPSLLLDLRFQYRHFVEWQNSCLRSGALNSQLSFWMRRLSGKLPEMQLPGNAAGPDRGAMKTRSFALPSELFEELREFNRREGITMFMSLLAAFKALLFHFTGQEDIRLGTLLFNRTSKDVEYLIGLFVNTLVLRTDLSGNPTLGEILRRIRAVVLDAHDNQDLPFEALVRILEQQPGFDRSTLFKILLVMQDVPSLHQDLPELSIVDFNERENDLHGILTTFDLILFFREEQTGLNAVIHYRAEAFEEATIDALLAHHALLLKEFIRDTQQTLDCLPKPA